MRTREFFSLAHALAETKKKMADPLLGKPDRTWQSCCKDCMHCAQISSPPHDWMTIVSLMLIYSQDIEGVTAMMGEHSH
jgi:hypothetical protein